MDTNKLISLMPDLAAFVTVVECGSFTAAGKKLGVTPSAVSRQISRLESALSIKLLERTTRQVRISESGKPTYDYCRVMLDSAREAVHASGHDKSDPAGYLRIAVPKAFGKQVLEPLIFPFLAQYPNIRLKLKITDYFVDPIKDEVDAIFRITDHPIEGLASRSLGQVELQLCATPEYLRQYGTPEHPKDLVRHNCLYLGEKTDDNHWEFVYGDQKVRVAVDGQYAVNHTEMRLNGILQGLGIGMLPSFTAESALREGKIVQVLADWKAMGNYQGRINIQYPRSRYVPAQLRCFIDYLVNEMT